MRRSFSEFPPRNLILLLAALAFGCGTTHYARRVGNLTGSPSPIASSESAKQQSDAINRATSKPYTGDLSIFEDPKRDENLQPNRIMDILGIKASSSVADIGAGSGWFTVRAARRVSNSGTIISTTSRSELDGRAWQTFARFWAKTTTRCCQRKASMLSCY